MQPDSQALPGPRGDGAFNASDDRPIPHSRPVASAPHSELVRTDVAEMLTGEAASGGYSIHRARWLAGGHSGADILLTSIAFRTAERKALKCLGTSAPRAALAPAAKVRGCKQ